MTKESVLKIAGGLCLLGASVTAAPKLPNVVIIYGDDVGYGDVGAYGAQKIPTPNIDRLAKEGIQFLDGHCTASTCTPSRYSMLSGLYGFREGVGILPPDAPLCIPTDVLTLPKLFKKAGYDTAVIGKWHLGLGRPGVKTDWNGAVKPGPLEIGFDYSFLLPSTNDRVPCVYLENHHVVNLDPNDPLYVTHEPVAPQGFKGTVYPDGRKNPEAETYYEADDQHSCSVIHGIGRIGYQWGGKSALWNDETMADEFVHQAKKYIASKKDRPFFLYFASQDIHVPRAPHPRFQGKTSLGKRGDAMVQFDWVTGEIVKTLEEHGLRENTIIVFSSDNGPVYDDGYKDGSTVRQSSQEGDGGHDGSGSYRGGKYQIYEGGTRVPFIISWPAKIKPGTSNALVNHIDFIASFADLLGVPLKPNEAVDSRNMLKAFLGDDPVGLPFMPEESFKTLGLRRGPWKYVTGHKEELYNLESDIGEAKNVISQFPEVAAEMRKTLTKVKKEGRIRNQTARPAKDRTVSDEQALKLANEILSKLTLEEKISLCHGSGTFTVGNIPRVGIEHEFTMVDNSSTVVGDVARMKWGTTEEGKKQTATAFPSLSAVGATWDRELTRQFADALGKEARFRGKDMQLGPGVNIHRTPLCGRNWEYFGEDPAHAAKMVVPYIKGLQQNDVAATVKHFVANNSEWNRYRVDSDPDERTLREIYFPAFEAAVKQGGVLSVMSGYNKVRGEWCSHSDYLNNQILKKEWGFKGLVVTDWDGLHDTMKGALGGTDLEMNMGANIRYFKQPLLDAVKNGTIPQAVLDDKVRRVLYVMAKTKFIGDHNDREKGAYETPEHTAIALKVAEDAITLLKNEDDILPLNPGKIKKLLVIGDNAIRKQCPGWHSGRANPKHETTPLEGIQNLLGEGVDVQFRNVKGKGDQLKQLPETWIRTQDPSSNRVGFGQPAFKVEYYNNTELKGQPAHTAYDKQIDFNKRRQRMPHGVRQKNISIRWSAIISPNQSGDYVLGAAIDDGVRIFVNNKPVVNQWNAGGKRIAKGNIHLEKGQEYDLRVEYLEYSGEAICEFGMIVDAIHDYSALAAEAAQADAVIYFTGNNHDMSQPVAESETVDRKSMALYPHDDEAITTVLKTRPDMVIVNLSGVAVSMPWIDDTKALIQYYFSGQEGGNAIANVLFGKVNPSGKLTFTIPKKLSDSPAHALGDYNGTHMTYKEGVFVGYRWFDAKNIEPLFSFGHGLSYTTFAVGKPKCSKSKMKQYGGVFVKVPVTNTGKVAGAEVVQLYVAPPTSDVERPVRELKTFGKVFLQPGETKEVEMWLSWRDLAYWHTAKSHWHVIPGTYQIEVGTSSREIRSRATLDYTL